MKGPMTPLQTIAMGLVIVFLETNSSYDIYANPLGWILVLAGVWQLTANEHRELRTVTITALVVSVPMWFPQIREPLSAADESLIWAAELPEFVFVVLLCRALMRAAQSSDPIASRGFGLLATLFGALALVPPVAIAGGLDGLAVGGTVALWVVRVWLIWSLFSHHNREYAKPPATTEATGGSGETADAD